MKTDFLRDAAGRRYAPSSPACITVLLTLTALVGLAAPAAATSKFDPAEARPCESERWARLEHLVDRHPQMKQERFTKLLEHHEPEIAKAFRRGDPPSSEFLLHYAAGWDTNPNPVPVLLVHGAGLSANHCFADKPIQQPQPGLAAALAESGRKVFALTFAHPHGDNFIQAEVVADCIARIKHVTQAEQIDLVAHSKGGMSCRIYLSDAGSKWATRYRGDVRRYVMLGTPNGGLDVSFAYPNLNYWILENKMPAPLSWTGAYVYGKWKDMKDQCVYAEGPFPGQAQMVARWDQRYGRTTSKGQYDVDTTYDGGRGSVSESRGIDQAIADGGDTMAKLQKKGIHPKVELAVLAGSNPWVMNLVGERRGPSDGLLLVASAFQTEGLERRGAKVLRKEIRYLNHLQLVYEPRANAWVVGVLDE